MKSFFGWAKAGSSKERGFTLVELLVVVGIIVALAAVIFPNVTQFSTKGDEGAKAAEEQNVQSAFDTMMADKNILTVTARNLGTTANAAGDFTALPAGTGAVPLTGYLRSNPTTYFYCWDSAGKITEQFTTAAACTQ